MKTKALHKGKADFVVIFSPDQQIGRLVRKNLGIHGSRTAEKRVAFVDNINKLEIHRPTLILVLARINESKLVDIKQLQAVYKGDIFYILFQENSPFPSDIERLDAMGLLKSIKKWHIHRLPDNNEETESALISRYLNFWLVNNNRRRIVDARLIDRELLIVSQNFEKLLIRVDTFSAFTKKSLNDLNEFEIDEDGSFIYWPKLDLHLGWEQLEHINDPLKSLKAKQDSGNFNKAYGAAMKQFREAQGLRQEDIHGLDSRQVRRIEHGACRATYSAITKFAQAHGMDPNAYMNEIAMLCSRLPNSH